MMKILKKTLTPLEESLSAHIDFALELDAVVKEMNEAHHFRLTKDRSFFLARRDTDDDWRSYSFPALALMIRRASTGCRPGGYSYSEAAEVVEKLAGVAPVAIATRRRNGRRACVHCGAIQHQDR